MLLSGDNNIGYYGNMLVLDVNFFSLGIEIDFGDMIKIILCNLMIFILKKEIVIINYDF